MQADEATVTLGVQTEDESASRAVGLKAELMNDVIDAIKGLSITEENMKTVAYSVSPVHARYDYTQIVGYQVTNMITVKITDMDLIGTVIDEAADKRVQTGFKESPSACQRRNARGLRNRRTWRLLTTLRQKWS